MKDIYKTQLENIINDFKNKVNHLSKSSVFELDDLVDDLKNKVDDLKYKINNDVDAIIDAIKQEKDIVLSEVDLAVFKAENHIGE